MIWSVFFQAIQDVLRHVEKGYRMEGSNDLTTSDLILGILSSGKYTDFYNPFDARLLATSSGITT
jgi:hypothetical protein